MTPRVSAKFDARIRHQTEDATVNANDGRLVFRKSFERDDTANPADPSDNFLLRLDGVAVANGQTLKLDLGTLGLKTVANPGLSLDLRINPGLVNNALPGEGAPVITATNDSVAE